jgi:hypothetical protein
MGDCRWKALENHPESLELTWSGSTTHRETEQVVLGVAPTHRLTLTTSVASATLFLIRLALGDKHETP